MSTDSRVMLVIQTRIKPDKNNLFEQWQTKIVQAAATFPGYISCDTHKPNPPLNLDWVITYYFTTLEAAKAWLQSPQRENLLKEAAPYLVGIDNLYLMQENQHDQTSTSASIVTKVAAGTEQKFLDWQARIAPLQSRFPGFMGCKVERPRQGSNDDWITLVTFDTDKNLERWLTSPERQKMVNELQTFASESHLEKLHVGFGSWFKKDGASRQVWKENMLVLLTLYPVVFLLSFIQNPVMKAGVPFWLALFFSNAISTVVLGSVTVPWLMNFFDWWLDTAKRTVWRDFMGACVIAMLYLLSIGCCWFLSRLV